MQSRRRKNIGKTETCHEETTNTDQSGEKQATGVDSAAEGGPSTGAPKRERVRLDSINVDDSPKMRTRIDQGAVEDYAAAFKGRAPVPPIQVMRDPKTGARGVSDSFVQKVRQVVRATACETAAVSPAAGARAPGTIAQTPSTDDDGSARAGAPGGSKQNYGARAELRATRGAGLEIGHRRHSRDHPP